MKTLVLTIIGLAFLLPTVNLNAGENFWIQDQGDSVLLAQAGPMDPGPTAPKQGCQEVKVHCKCTNPDKDFFVPNVKIGKVNPGEPGECRSKSYIDTSAKLQPIAFCLKGESGVRDERKGQSQCTATWTCEKPCEIKDTIK